MNNPQLDGRRLHSRFQTNETEAIISFSGPNNSLAKSAVKVIDVSKDCVTCRGSHDLIIPIGTKVTLKQSRSNSKKILEGKVTSYAHRSEFVQIGIFFPAKTVFSLFPPSNDIPSPNQRRTSRREGTSEETGKREFERRGFWPGFLSKRVFSHYIWGLQNRNEYFFLKPIQSATGAHVIVDGREMIMMSSNSYLGLTTHPKVTEAAIAAIKKYGSGAGASAVIGGAFDIHFQLEDALAKFEDVEAVCLFSSGYVANVATLLTILRKGDAVFNDELNHASLLDGSRLSRADFRAFHHGDIDDLNLKLSKCRIPHKLVVIDGVFSMDGDIALLPDIIRTCKKHGAALMVDEAHATGVYGKKGRGLLEHYEMQGKADLVIGTMSKALGASGGFIGGSKELIKILKHSARGSIFSANLSPSICATVLTALRLIDEEPQLRENLWRNAHHLHSGLQALGFNIGNTQSPIIPVIFPTEAETNQATKYLREQGIFACPVVYPAVKRNQSRVRLTVTATHSEKDIDKVLTVFKKIRHLTDEKIKCLSE